MNVYDSGYGAWKFNPDSIRDRMNGILARLEIIKMRHEVDCILVHGSSGLWLGGMLTVAQDLPVVQVRKPNESSHGCDIEGKPGRRFRGVFVDDFISLGSTVDRVRELIDRDGFEVVAVLEHGKSEWTTNWGAGYNDLPVYQALPSN